MFSKAISKLSLNSSSNGNKIDQPDDRDTEKHGMEKKVENRPRIKPENKQRLQANGIPLISCRDLCSDPCSDEESESYHWDPKTITAWKKQEIELSSDLLGSTKPFLRHALISTGKKDWDHDISTLDGSLAQQFGHLNEAYQASRKSDDSQDQDRLTSGHAEEVQLPEGCWQTLKPSNPSRNQSKVTTKLNFANSSHFSNSSFGANQSVMLFPDWLLVTEVPQLSSLGRKPTSEEKESMDGRVKDAFDRFITPDATGIKERKEIESDLKVPKIRRWVLPYKAVIVLCSHKKRDVRCHLAAPLLASAFRSHAEAAGWEVDERGDDVASHHKPQIDDPNSISGLQKTEEGLIKSFGFGHVEETEDETANQEQILKWRKRAHLGLDENALLPTHESNEPNENGNEAGKLGIFYCSHIGGHKFSGNVIIYFPNGAGVWLGRVDPLKDAGIVFEQTIQKGIVIEEFLRAGINLKRDGSDVKRSGTATELRSGGASGKGILRW